MNFIVNGNIRSLELAEPTLEHLISALQLQGDRVAVEHNGSIVQRANWAATAVTEGDKLEIVHFVGGGCY